MPKKLELKDASTILMEQKIAPKGKGKRTTKRPDPIAVLTPNDLASYKSAKTKDEKKAILAKNKIACAAGKTPKVYGEDQLNSKGEVVKAKGSVFCATAVNRTGITPKRAKCPAGMKAAIKEEGKKDGKMYGCRVRTIRPPRQAEIYKAHHPRGRNRLNKEIPDPIRQVAAVERINEINAALMSGQTVKGYNDANVASKAVKVYPITRLNRYGEDELEGRMIKDKKTGKVISRGHVVAAVQYEFSPKMAARAKLFKEEGIGKAMQDIPKATRKKAMSDIAKLRKDGKKEEARNMFIDLIATQMAKGVTKADAASVLAKKGFVKTDSDLYKAVLSKAK